MRGRSLMSITIGAAPAGAGPGGCAGRRSGKRFPGRGADLVGQRTASSTGSIFSPRPSSVSDPDDGRDRSVRMPELVGAIVPRRRGGFVAAMQGGFKAIDLATGKASPIASAGVRPARQPLQRRQMRPQAAASGPARWRIDTTPAAGSPLPARSGRPRDRDGDAASTSPTALAGARTTRRSTSPTPARRTIFVYDFDAESGAIENRRIFAEVPEGSGTPDGLTVDAEGFVWSAHWDGWCVTRYDPDGAVDRVITLPVPRPTSCMFGGAGPADPVRDQRADPPLRRSNWLTRRCPAASSPSRPACAAFPNRPSRAERGLPKWRVSTSPGPQILRPDEGAARRRPRGRGRRVHACSSALPAAASPRLLRLICGLDEVDLGHDRHRRRDRERRASRPSAASRWCSRATRSIRI